MCLNRNTLIFYLALNFRGFLCETAKSVQPRECTKLETCASGICCTFPVTIYKQTELFALTNTVHQIGWYHSMWGGGGKGGIANISFYIKFFDNA